MTKDMRRGRVQRCPSEVCGTTRCRNDGQDTGMSNSAADVVMEDVEPEKSGDKLRVCVGCKLAVHEKCYADALPLAVETEEKENAVQQSRESRRRRAWAGMERQVTKCVYCGKAGGDKAMKVVEKSGDDEFWKQCKKVGEQKEAGAEEFGHKLCINWDPRRLAAHIVKESKIKPVEKVSKKRLAKEEAALESKKDTDTDTANEDTEEKEKPPVEESEDVVPDVNEAMLRDPVSPGECSFCHSSAGVRIQCRRVNCAQFFHALCAHEGNGHVELRTGHILQFHAYCERHRDCTEDIGDLLAKLITRPIRLLVGRDDMRRFGTVAKHLPDYTSAAAIMRDLAALMVGYCHKGLRASKSEPPDYNVKHLQVLQFFLSHVPQLEKVYALPPTPVQDFVNDKKLFRRLERTFNPPRYLAKYPGPFSQQHTCDVCLDPFHERQHLFYCSGGEESETLHVQHWRCTKRRSNVRERERYLQVAGNNGTKKKRNVISVVQDGVRKDITLPKGLPSMTDDIICGVCRAPVDARGLIASRKEAKRLDFEKKESKFVQNGCYINPVGARGYSGYSYNTGSNASSRKPPKPTDGKTNGNLTGQHAAAQQALGPQRWTESMFNARRASKMASANPTVAKSPSPTNKPAATGPVANGAVTTGAISSNKEAETKSTPTAPDSASGNSTTAALPKPESNEKAPTPATTRTSGTQSSKVNDTSLLTPAMQTFFDEAMRLVRPYDSYALSKLESAYDMLLHRSGPGIAVLRMLTHEYTRFVYIKHTRAVEKARNEKRKRAEHEAQEHREKERKRMNLEAERALKKQMLAMRNKQRQHLKATSSKKSDNAKCSGQF
ncbi:Zinc finger, RING/FYVE/PHD-type [Phytophthora cactorum]|nr:Zinc finger, RING/FYVE/PHD-type [Phytophthora cactorum]